MMDQAVWKQAKAIFHRVSEAETGDRAALLDRLCAGLPEVRVEVEALLDAHEASARSEGADSPATTVEPGESPGDVIDRFKLLQEIGTGGFGTVYMAEQSEPVRRRVALKVIKLGMDSRQIVARFEAEQQALAVMDHPNIAKVLDGGTTQSGRPYFVMELVRGLPLVEYCDQAGLDTVQRLELFQEVCHAVQHAHQKGIIHRDIKPSNVLVAIHDGRPVPKVIDFGIAKALDRTLTEKTLFTEFRQIVGTPEYMAPEQAGFSSLDIDTRADIYSLGVVLYELLTGAKPFDWQELLERGYGEVLRTIREVDPPRPSTRLSTLGDQLPVVAKQRHTAPQQLNRLVRGDLDWIVMRALEKDRARRYDSATAFAADIGRHLANEPVLACPPSRSYRLRKYVRRHRMGALAASIAVLALVLGSGVALAGWSRARADRDRADLAYGEAMQAAETAREAFRALGGMLAQGSPERLGPKATLGQLLEAVEEDIPQLARTSPGAESVVRHALSTAYADQGQLDEAERHARRAHEIAHALYGADAESTLDALGNRAIVLGARGETAEALALQRQVVDGYRALEAVSPGEMASKLVNLASLIPGRTAEELAERQRLLEEATEHLSSAGDSYAELLYVPLAHLAEAQAGAGRIEDALELQRRSLRLRRLHRPSHHPVVLRGSNTLGSLLFEAGRMEEAATELESAAKGYEQLGEDRGDRWTNANNLACLRANQGAYLEAANLLGGVVRWRTDNLGADHPLTLEALVNLAAVHGALGGRDAALRRYREAVAGFRSRGLGHTLECAQALRGLAIQERQGGEPAESAKHHREVLSVVEALYGSEHPQVVRTLQALAMALADAGLHAEAAREARRGLELARRLEQPQPALEAMMLHALGFLAMRQNRLEEALGHLEDQVEVLAGALGPDHVQVALARGDMGTLLSRLGRWADATPLFEQARAVLDPRLTVVHPYVLDLRGTVLLNDVCTADGADVEEAIAYLEDCRRAHGPLHARTLRARRLVGLAQLAAGAPVDAAAHLEGVMRALEAVAQPSTRQLRELRLVRADLGAVLTRQQRFDAAEPLLLQALDEPEDAPLDLRVSRQRTIERIVDLYEAWERSDEAAAWRKRLEENEAR